jgi:DNA-binding MarR family transcriptional regulator
MPAKQKTLAQTSLRQLLGYNLRRAWLVNQADWGARMGELALTAAEFSVLALLRENGEANQKALCSALNVPPPNMVVIVDRLVTRGIVLRTPSATDKRVSLLTLSPHGRKLAEDGAAVAHAIERQATPGLTDAERAQLNALLIKVAHGG